MTDDEKMATEEFSVGSLAHELSSVIDDLIKKHGAQLDTVFDSVICAHLALGSLIIAHMEWRAKQGRKQGINERMVQIRH